MSAKTKWMVVTPWTVDGGHSVSVHVADSARDALEAGFEYGHSEEGVYAVIDMDAAVLFDIRERRILEPARDNGVVWPGQEESA